MCAYGGNRLYTVQLRATDQVDYVATSALSHLGENTVDILAMNGAGLVAKRSQTIKVTGEKIYFPIIEAR